MTLIDSFSKFTYISVLRSRQSCFDLCVEVAQSFADENTIQHRHMATRTVSWTTRTFVLFRQFNNVSKQYTKYTKYLSKIDNDDNNYNYYYDEDAMLIQVKIDKNQQLKIEASQPNHRLPEKLQNAIEKRATLLLASSLAQRDSQLTITNNDQQQQQLIG